MFIWLFALGIIHVPIYTHPLPSIVLFLCGGCLSVCVYLLRRHGLFLKFAQLLSWFVCFLLGASLGSFQLNQLCRHQLGQEFDGLNHSVIFKILSIPQNNNHSISFLARVQSIECAPQKKCPELSDQKIRISWYRTHETVQAGQVWQASVQLKRPRGFVNPSGFDYQAWLLSQGIVATGYVRTKSDMKPILITSEVVLAGERKKINDRLLRPSERQFDRFWSALLIGERSAISLEDWRILQATGTIHLMAISGLHIGLVALFCYGFGAFCIRFWAMLHFGSGVFAYRFIPAIFSSSGAFYYAAMAGFSIPTLRALIACLLVSACRVSGVKLPAMKVVGICIVIIGLMEPLLWVNTGFWLSFTAVGLLVFSMGGRYGGHSRWAWVKIQCILSIGMMLPLVFIGQGFSVVGPLANLVSVPLLSLIIIPILLLASILQYFSESLAQWMLQCLDQLFAYLWWFLTYLEAKPFARWWPSQVLNLAVLIIGFVGALLCLSPFGLRVKALALVWLLYAGWGRLATDESFRLTVMDVGQGLAVVVNTPESTWVYDTGPQYSEQFDSGSRIIAPYLRVLGVAQTSLIVSHNDLDHSGGVQGLMANISVKHMYYGEPIAAAHQSGTQCVQGQTWESDHLRFEVLWPPLEAGFKSNRASCVIHMTYESKGHTLSVLLTGDIDRFVEQQLLSKLPASVDILIAPHHGSNGSSSVKFINHVKPTHVVFSAGFNNRYHHPNSQVISRYQQVDSILYNTAEDGAVSFIWTDRDDLIIQKTRITEPKLWH